MNNSKVDAFKFFESDHDAVNFLDVVKSMFVSSGPWIVSIVTLLSIKLFIKDIIPKEIFDIFMNIIIYVFIFSMVLASPFINMVNRYLADKIYVKDYDNVLSIFMSSVILIGVISYTVSFTYLSFYTNLQEHAFVITNLFTAVSVMWLMMIFISIFKSYSTINYSFISGMIVAFVLLLFFLNNTLDELIMAFTAGILFIIALLTAKLSHDFDYDNTLDFNYLKKKKYYAFFLSAFFLYMGMWMDKFIYWFSPKGTEVAKGFYFFPEYDFVIFIAYLVLLPTTAYLTEYLDKVFYQAQQTYFDAIQNKKTFAVIENHTRNIQDSFFRGLFKITLMQFLFSLVFIFTIQYLFDKYDVNIISLPILRIAVFAVTLQIILTSIIMFLYYFDFQKEIVAICFIYFILNTVLTLFMVDLPYEYVGYSYFLSVLITLFVAFFISLYKMEKINYYMIARNEV